MSDFRPVRVFTDSTSDLPADLRDSLNIGVIPLTVTFGSTTYLDGVDITPMEFLKKLKAADKLPSTSQPPMTTFEAAFRDAIDQGSDVVCITVSAELSGTFNSARLAAEAVDPERVIVIDSRTASMTIGWVAVAAARTAAAGGTLEEVVAEARSAKDRTKLFTVLQTLDYVYKGGRIGRAQHLFGSALAIKPILSVTDGIVEPVERVRTWKKAVTRVIELVSPTPSDIMVLHTDNLPDAEMIASALQLRYPEIYVGIGQAGPVITTYAGPGAIGVFSLYP